MTLCEWKQPVSGPPFSGLCLRLPHPSRPPSKAKHSNRTVGGRDAPSWDPHLSKGPISSLLTPGPPFPFTSPPFSTLRIHRAPPPTQLLFAQQDHQPDGGLGPRLPPKIGLLAVLCSSAFGGSLLPWDHSTRFPWGCLLPPPPTGLLHTPGVTLSLPPHFLTLPQLSELLFTLQWSHSSAPPGSLPDAPRLVSPRPPVPSENCKRLMSVLHGLRVFPAGRVLPTSSPTPSTWHGEATAPLAQIPAVTDQGFGQCPRDPQHLGHNIQRRHRRAYQGRERIGRFRHSKSLSSPGAPSSTHLCPGGRRGRPDPVQMGMGAERGRSRWHRSRVPRTRMGTRPPLPPAGFPSSRTLVLCQRSRLVGAEMP